MWRSILIRIANNNDLPFLKQIWNACFNDSMEYIDFYYKITSNFTRTFVYTTPKNEIAAMLNLYNAVLKLENRHYPVNYIYAAATDAKYRCQGIMAELINYVLNFSKKSGFFGCVLVPQNKELVNYYNKFGFNEKINLKLISYKPENNSKIDFLGNCAVQGNLTQIDCISPCTLDEFMSLRKNFLEKISYLSLNPEGVEFSYYDTIDSGGEFVKNARNDYAVCYKVRENLLVNEISSPNKIFLDSLAKHFNVNEIKYQVPCDGIFENEKCPDFSPGNVLNSKKLYGLYCNYDNDIKLTDNIYMNMMLE